MTFHCFGQTERRFSRNSHPSSWIKLMRTKQNKLQVRKVVVPSSHFMAHFLNQLWIYFYLFRFIAPPASHASCRGTPYSPTHVRSPAAAGWLRYLFCLYLKSHTHYPRPIPTVLIYNILFIFVKQSKLLETYVIMYRLMWHYNYSIMDWIYKILFHRMIYFYNILCCATSVCINVCTM